MFFSDNAADKKSQRILQELENIDDEADAASIAFVKISDDQMLREYDLDPLPALVYFRDKFPMIYPGDLTKEEAVLDWVFKLKESDRDQIEEVDHRTLRMLLDELDHVAVLFCKFTFRNTNELLHRLLIQTDSNVHFLPILDNQTTKTAARIATRSSKNSRQSTTTQMTLESTS